RVQRGVSDELRLERCLLRAQDGDLAEVQETLWHFIEEQHPDTALILEALVLGYMKVGSSKAGQAALARLLEMEPDNLAGLYWRGVISAHRGNEQAALADYRRVLELNPEHPEARKRLADLLVTRDPVEARTHLDRLLQSQPRDPALLLSLFRCLKA